MAALKLHASNSGFSLIEIMVVIVIAGVLTGAALFSLSGGEERRARQEAERLRQAMQMVADEAYSEGARTGVSFTQTGYVFLRYDGATRQWLPLAEPAFSAHELPAGLHFTLSAQHTAIHLPEALLPRAVRPALVWYEGGESPAFELDLCRQNGTPAATLASDGLTPVAARLREAL